MNRIKRLLRLRKQDDCIKLALLLFLAAAWLAYIACVQGIEYARIQARPVEYVLESNFSGAVLEGNLQKIQALDGVAGVSRQREFSITVGDKMLTVTELERQYLTDCCGIEPSNTGSRYWLNREAFTNLLGSGAASPARVIYKKEEKTESGEFLLLSDFGGEEAFAASTGSTMTLGNVSTLRVMFAHGDPSGADIRKLESMGFTVLNQAEMERQSYETELALTKLSYASVAAFFALTGGLAFLKCSKEKHRKAR